jgi:hypothetical protein
MRTLYEINAEYLNLLETAFTVDEETGEVLFDNTAFEAIRGEYNDKIDSIVNYIKSLETLCEGIKKERDNLAERKAQVEKKIESLKEYISKSMELRNMDKFETPKAKLSFRVSKSVNVIDEELIPDDYFKESVSKKLDKASLLKDIKEGKEVKGACLLVKRNLQIK